MSDEGIVRERLHEVASLPSDDPLRELVARRLDDPRIAAACSEADAEEARLRAALLAVSVPDLPELEDRLRRIPGQRRRVGVGWLVLAAAVVLAFGLGLGIGRSRTPLVIAPIALVQSAEEARCLAASVDPHTRPRVVAIKFWHELCPACQELDPRYAEVLDDFDDGSVLFLTFDMSSTFSRKQAALLAEVLGVKALFDASRGDFGFVALIDADDRRPLGRITAKQDEGQMKRSIREALVLADAAHHDER